MKESIARLSGDTVQRRVECAERGTLPGLVGSKHDMEAWITRAQIKRLTAEWTECRECQFEDLHETGFC